LWLFVSVFPVTAEGKINREVWFVIIGVLALSLAVGGHLTFLNNDTFFIVHATRALVPIGTGLHQVFKAQWSLCAPFGLTLKNSSLWCLWISEQTAIISLYNINWLVCITETECVYCTVRTNSFSVVFPTITQNPNISCLLLFWQ